MENCSVIKLGGIINNYDLDFVYGGTMRNRYVSNPNATQGFRVSVSKETKLKIVGDGYFTDELSSNQGREITLSPDEEFNVVRVSNSNCKVVFADTRNVVKFIPIVGEGSKLKIIEFDISIFANAKDMKQITYTSSALYGNISSLENCHKINIINLSSPYGNGVYGSITELANKLAPYKKAGDKLDITGNGFITIDGETIIDNDAIKTITFDGKGGFIIL